ncbi:MAG: sulfatase-like hydrolase/transferase, partial [Myxococcota bacterium]
MLLSLLLLACAPDPDPVPGAPNILLILLDDVGQDGVAAYGVSPDPPVTPVLDGLADAGIRFTRAYAYPSCKPSRGALLTGRYVRSGVLTDDLRLRASTRTLADVAREAGYETALFGKWHLSGRRLGQTRAPLRHGFDHFEGRMGNFIDTARDWDGRFDYTRWEFVRNGRTSLVTGWAPTVVVDAAEAWIAERDGPWFAYVALSAAHGPMHVPPADLQSTGVDEGSSNPEKFRAIVEAADTELGRLLGSLTPETLANTVVIVAGDNGTDAARDDPDFDVLGGKTTMFEGGIRVPLIVTGPPVTQPGAVHGGLVHLVDVLPTIAELVAGEVGESDGQSLLPVVTAPERPGERTALFAEQLLDVLDRRAMISRTLKLVDEAHRGTRWVARPG